MFEHGHLNLILPTCSQIRYLATKWPSNIGSTHLDLDLVGFDITWQLKLGSHLNSIFAAADPIAIFPATQWQGGVAVYAHPPTNRCALLVPMVLPSHCIHCWYPCHSRAAIACLSSISTYPHPFLPGLFVVCVLLSLSMVGYLMSLSIGCDCKSSIEFPHSYFFPKFYHLSSLVPFVVGPCLFAACCLVFLKSPNSCLIFFTRSPIPCQACPLAGCLLFGDPFCFLALIQCFTPCVSIVTTSSTKAFLSRFCNWSGYIIFCGILHDESNDI